MITDLEGGESSPDRGRAVRAVSIALGVAALMAYAALVWPASGGQSRVDAPEVTAAVNRVLTWSILAPSDPSSTGVVSFTCSGMIGRASLTNVYVISAMSLQGAPPAAAATDRVSLPTIEDEGRVAAGGQSLVVSRCLPETSPARDAFVP